MQYRILHKIATGNAFQNRQCVCCTGTAVRAPSSRLQDTLKNLPFLKKIRRHYLNVYRKFITNLTVIVIKQKTTSTEVVFLGASDLTRTGDLLITSEMHYRLCYTSKPAYYIGFPVKSQLLFSESSRLTGQWSDPRMSGWMAAAEMRSAMRLETRK